VGGWGCDSTGQTDGGAVTHIPVLFVHGATRDAHDFDQDRQYFLDHGYSACELWAVSYGYGSMQNPETNAGSEAMVKDFVHGMLTWIQQNKNPDIKQIDIVSHSLGGTVVRKWLADSGENALVHSFVPIAAPNHGAAICLGPTSSSPVCQEIAPGSQWLSDLNARGEAPAGVRTMTIYDGTGQYDQIYTGSLAESPALKGATNHPYNREQGTALDHEGLINGTMALQLQWLQNAQTAKR
jgi:triacylglycerol lipase